MTLHFVFILHLLLLLYDIKILLAAVAWAIQSLKLYCTAFYRVVLHDIVSRIAFHVFLNRIMHVSRKALHVSSLIVFRV